MFQEKAFYYDENTEVLKSPHTYKILPDLLWIPSWIDIWVRKSRKDPYASA